MDVHTINGFKQNPLQVLTEAQLDRQVAQFEDQHNLTHIRPLLRQGAHIARAPNAPPVLHELGDADQRALRDEHLHRFRQPAKFWLAISYTCCAAVLQGWAQVGFVPGTKVWEKLHPDSPSHGQDWKVGLVVAIPYLVAALLGCWLSEPLNEHFGRRGPILIGAVVNLAASFGAAGGRTWYQVLVCRAFTGIAMGLKASVSPIFAAELSPPSIRGSTVVGAWQICVASGILFGYSVALGVNHMGERYWRYQIASPFILSVPVIVLFFYCEESPRWLVKKGRYLDAYHALCHIRNREIQAARDLFAIAAQVLHEEDLLHVKADEIPYRRKLTQLFSEPRNLSATVAAGAIMLGQQLCGINVVIFFGYSLFQTGPSEASGRTNKALWAMWFVGLVNVLFGLPGVYLSDRIGRRRLLLWLYPPMCVFMLGAGLASMIPSDANTWVISVFIVLFVASYSPGQGPCAFLYASESFPVTHREVGMSFSVAINLFWAGVLALLYPHMNVTLAQGRGTDVYKPDYVLITFALLNLVAMALVYFLCPETKRYTLEELDRIFAYRVLDHVIDKLRILGDVLLGRVPRKKDTPQTGVELQLVGHIV